MAARRMTKLLRLGLGSSALAALPLTYTGFKVYAAGPNCVRCNCPLTSCACPKPNCVKISELPIYGNQDGSETCIKEEEITTFKALISDVRCAIWDYLDTVQVTTDKVKGTLNVGKSHVVSTINFFQNDPAVLPRTAVILVAGLGGLVAGYRGGVIRKLLYSTGAITAATSLCYPKETVSLATGSYDYVYVYLTDMWHGKESLKKSTGEPTRPWIDNKNQNANTNHNPDVDQNQNAYLIQNQSEVDLKKMKLRDQSKPEDKDMYTTRSK